ncbi:MAG: peptidylprolyl isomerase [bacterium]
MLRRYITALIFLTLLLAVSGCAEKDYPLAEVGGKVFYKSYFEKLFVPMPNATYEENKIKADQVFENTLKQITAYAYLEKNNMIPENVVQMRIQQENNKLIESVYKQEVLDRIRVSEKEIHETYKRQKTTIWSQHILTKEKALADSIYQILKRSPERFGEMAALFSEDTNNKNNEGNLREFSGGTFVKEFEDACMKMPVGVISKPIQTPFGYHIIRVKKRELKDMSNYATEKKAIEASLKKKLTTDEVVKSEKRLRDLAKMEINVENIGKVLSSLKRDSTGAVMIDSLKEEKDLILVSSTLGKWNIRTIDSITAREGFGKVPYNSPDALKAHIDRVVFFKTIYEKGKRMGADMASGFKKDIELKMAIITEQQIVKDIRASIVTDDTTLVNYYKSNIAKFTEKGRVGIYIMINDDSMKVQMVKDSLAKKNDFRHFSKLYSKVKPKEFSKPDYYIYTEDDSTGYYQQAISLGKVNKVSGIFRNEGGFNMIKVMEIVPPKPTELTDAFKNGMLKNDYLKSVTDSIINTEYEKAKTEMKFVVYKDKYEKLLEEILAKTKETK